MKLTKLCAATWLSTSLVLAPAIAHAGEIGLGVLLTTSGPAGALGQHAQTGVELALEELGNKLGGMNVALHVADAEGKPDIAVQKAIAMVDRDHADIVISSIFSNILTAVAGPISQRGAFVVSPNAGPSTFAGESCDPNVFVASWQNDQVAAALGTYVTQQEIKNVITVAPNYNAGRDQVNGFKSTYKEALASELYVPLGQLDFSAEIAQIGTMQPEAVFAFLPGGMGVNFLRQFKQSGLDSIPVMSVFTVDGTTLTALGDAAIDTMAAGVWAFDMDTAENKKFVDSYKAKYGHLPSIYAAMGYDAVKLINEAVQSAGGVEDKDALRKAFEAAKFKSIRGDFEFGPNHFPVQDFYLLKAQKNADGEFAMSKVGMIVENGADSFASECKMK